LWLIAFVLGHVLCDYDFSYQNFSLLSKIRKIENSIFRYKYITLFILIVILLFSEYFLNKMGINRNVYFLTLSFIVVYFTIRNDLLNFILSGKIPKWLGKISFSIYLIHLPIIFSFTSYFLLFNMSMIYKITISLSTIVLCFALSLLYENYIDKNGVKLANSIGEFFKRNN
jgi:peptidoglycan/LPS O-acetylase OafA/YrhL